MSGGMKIRLPFGDAEREFFLGVGGLRELQVKCDAGPEEIAARLLPSAEAVRLKVSTPSALANGLIGRWRVDDVREPIYRGLIGGGMEPTEAGGLVMDLVDKRPLRENIALAYAIVIASIQGVPDEPLGEGKGAARKTRARPSRAKK